LKLFSEANKAFKHSHLYQKYEFIINLKNESETIAKYW